jgi:hypothetical protein
VCPSSPMPSSVRSKLGHDPDSQHARMLDS